MNTTNTTPADYPLLAAYADGLLQATANLLSTTIGQRDPKLSPARAGEVAAAVIFARYQIEVEAMNADDRLAPPGWFEALWDFYADSANQSVAHILIRATGTRTLFDDAIALTSHGGLGAVTKADADTWLPWAINRTRDALAGL
jgi:hypothetical protein